MQTPPAIVPEWYLLPFYAILRSIPNKLLGVIAMLSAILILLVMPFTDLSRSRGIQFRPLSKIAFYIFIANFLILMVLGAKHVESPYIELGQISTVIYFAHFLIIVPFISLLENSLVELENSANNIISPQVKFLKFPSLKQQIRNMEGNSGINEGGFVPVASYIGGRKSLGIAIQDNKNKSGIFCWTHLYNKKSYIDSSQDIGRTLAVPYTPKIDVFSLEQFLILKSISEQGGLSNFKLEILEYCDPKNLAERKQYYLDLLQK